MYNLLISLVIGALVFVAVMIPFGWIAALFPALVVLIGVYVLLARRTSKQLERAMPEVQKHLMARRFDPAIAELEGIRHLGRWQFLITPVIDAQIGMIFYAYKQQPEKAVPYLQKAYAKQPQAKLMLGAWHYKRKEWDQMEQAFDEATRHNKKSGLAWNTWAWCEWKRGRKEKAMEVVNRGLKHLPDDERLKTNLVQLQNDKRMKMKGYAEEWWALLLERPPTQMMQPGGRAGGRGRMPRRR